MPFSFFKEHEKLGDSSKFVAWNVRLEIVTDNNHVLDFIEGRKPKPQENASAAIENKHKKGKGKPSKLRRPP